MAATTTVPAWVHPGPAAVADAAAATQQGDDYSRGVHAAIAWVVDVTYDQAGQRMTEALDVRADRYQAGIADCLAWMMGFASAPIELPRRNADGTLVTAAQLVAARRAASQLSWEPEQLEVEQRRAERLADHWAALAAR